MAALSRTVAAALACVVAASPFDPHPLPGHGPWFEGWFTRIVDPAKNISVVVIAGSYEPQNASVLTTTWVGAIVSRPDGTVTTEQVFPGQESVRITKAGQPVVKPPAHGEPAEFEWTSSIGSIAVTPDGSSTLSFRMPSGLAIDATMTGRVPWDPSCPEDCGPEGWVGKLPSGLLPTNYFVQTLASKVTYTVGGISGEGFAHQETNFGARFPTAWTWMQGVSSDGKTQLLLTGGAFTVAGVTIEQFLLGYRSPHRQWDFRGIDLDPIDVKMDGCAGTLKLSARALTGGRRVEVEAAAPAGSFCEPLFFPTATGWSNKPGSVESYTSTATIRLFEGSSKEPVEEVELRQVALEFGGTYMCKPSAAEAAAQVLASVVI